MAREITVITGTILNKALRSLGQTEYEIGDARVAGLCLRVRRKHINWALRCRIGGKQTIRTIGSAQRMKDVEKVRELALRGKAMIEKGEDPKMLFEEAHAASEAGDVDEALAGVKAREEAIQDAAVWTWDDLRDAFLADTLERKRKHTWRSYKSALNLPDWAPLNGKRIARITADDVRSVRSALIARGTAAQSAAAMRVAKAAFGWACDHPDSGLTLNPIRDLKVIPRRKSVRPGDVDVSEKQSKQRLITLEELAVLQRELATYPSKRHRLITLLALYTAQRRLTVASALKQNFAIDPNFGPVWAISGAMTKAGRQHVIPLPPAVWQVVEEAMQISRDDSPWLFPQLRPGPTTTDMSSHMNEKSINDVLNELQQPGRKLHSAHPFTPHDFRRAFATHLRRTGVSNAECKLILDHKEGRGGDITEEHCSLDELLDDKRTVMEKWIGLLLSLPQSFCDSTR